MSFSDGNYDLALEKLDECFIMSMMNVMDEQNKMNKYEHLLFVEFLEMLCRVALVALNIDDLIEYKVLYLMDNIYSEMYKRKKMSEKDYPLIPVDESYVHIHK